MTLETGQKERWELKSWIAHLGTGGAGSAHKCEIQNKATGQMKQVAVKTETWLGFAKRTISGALSIEEEFKYGNKIKALLQKESDGNKYKERILLPFGINSPKNTFLVMSLAEGTLENWKYLQNGITGKEWKYYAKWLLEMFAWLEEKGWYHVDMKPDNIFRMKQNNTEILVIADVCAFFK